MVEKVPQHVGCLYVVATPIGNLRDISNRAIETLRSCDWVACEDTRKTGRLLKALAISRPLYAYHEHNERREAMNLAERIAVGQSGVLVSDAGTPGISDPGFRLVRECRRRGLPVSPIPGPTAALTALAASGLPGDGFLFAGFLPPKAVRRQAFLRRYQDLPYTLIFYESRYRIKACLDAVVETLGEERALCVAREMTKLHECFFVGPAVRVRDQVLDQSCKGEFVVLIAKVGYRL